MKLFFGSFALRLIAVFLVGTVAVSGCSSKAPRDPSDRPFNPFKKDDKKDLLPKRPAVTDEGLKAEAQAFYRLARKSMDAGEYTDAMTRYEQVIERYPFTEYATQAELDKIYVQHRDFKPDDALAAAERFLRDHPRHPSADYVQYLKGVIQTERDAGLLQSLPVDTTKQDVSNLRKAYDEFALLIQKYPNSRYDVDARARMIDLRNRIAQNEMHAVRYYLRRGANLAAARRAEQIITQYPGAPASLEALKVLGGSLREMGLDADAKAADQLLAQQTGQRSVEKVESGGIKQPAISEKAPLSTKPEGRPGLLARFANLFSALDPDKNPGPTLIIPTGDKPAAAKTETASSGGAPAADGKPANGNRLSISINTGDDETPAKPVTKPAANAADASAPPAVATPAKAADSAPPPAAPAPKRPGFFARVFTSIAGWFSFLDPNKPAK